MQTDRQIDRCRQIDRKIGRQIAVKLIFKRLAGVNRKLKNGNSRPEFADLIYVWLFRLIPAALAVKMTFFGGGGGGG